MLLTDQAKRRRREEEEGEIEAAAVGRGVTAVIQRLGSWHTREKFSGL
jgi:hypothetical protein